VPQFTSLRDARQQLRESSQTFQSGAVSSVYLLSSSTISGTESPSSPCSIVDSFHLPTVGRIMPVPQTTLTPRPTGGLPTPLQLPGARMTADGTPQPPTVLLSLMVVRISRRCTGGTPKSAKPTLVPAMAFYPQYLQIGFITLRIHSSP
jgi:hypothetical protein